MFYDKKIYINEFWKYLIEIKQYRKYLTICRSIKALEMNDLL